MRRAWVGGAVAAGLLFAACGGGGGLSKADYVEQANAVCREAARNVAALDASGSDVEQLPEVAGGVVVAQRKALDKLKAIKAPKEDRTEIAKWIALVDQTIDQAEVSAQAQRSGDITRAMAANVNGAALDRRADQLALSYGLRRCVRAATAPSSTTTTAPAG